MVNFEEIFAKENLVRAFCFDAETFEHCLDTYWLRKDDSPDSPDYALSELLRASMSFGRCDMVAQQLHSFYRCDEYILAHEAMRDLLDEALLGERKTFWETPWRDMLDTTPEERLAAREAHINKTAEKYAGRVEIEEV